MVVSIDIYAVLTVIELIVSLMFVFFIFFKRKKMSSRIIRFITSSILLILNLIQIQIQKSDGSNNVGVLIWFTNAVIAAYELKKNN